MGIGLEGFYFVGKLGVFFCEAIDVGLDAFDFLFSAAHGEVTVSAEDVVKEKREDTEDEYGASVLGPENGEFALFRHAIDIEVKEIFRAKSSAIWVRFRISEERLAGVNAAAQPAKAGQAGVAVLRRKNPVGGFAD